ncbi:transposase [Sphaerisporangium perillae]
MGTEDVEHGRWWSPSHFAASCGGAPLTITKQYIEHQRRPT